MTRHAAFLTFSAACSLLLAGPSHASGPRPTTQARRLAPTRRPPAAPWPTAPTLVAAATSAPAETAPQPPTEPRMVSVSGIVRGADGQPRAGVSIFPSATPRLLTVTDAKGAFSLRLPAAAGPVRLQADYFGVGNSRFEVDGQHPQPVTIVLGQ